jgi:hypothetical protein
MSAPGGAGLVEAVRGLTIIEWYRLTGGIGLVDRVAIDVRIGVLGLVDERVDGEELPCLGVVVAVDQVGEATRLGSTVSLGPTATV